jgi:hypothetical protein
VLGTFLAWSILGDGGGVSVVCHLGSDLSVGPVSSGHGSGVPDGQQLPCRLHALGQKHAILAGAALGARDEIVDLVDERPQKRLMLRSEGMTERGESDVAGLAEGLGGAADEVLADVAALGKFCYLFIHIDIDVQKASGVLMNDAFLLSIEEVEKSSILLEFVLQHGDDLLEAGLDVHGMDEG